MKTEIFKLNKSGAQFLKKLLTIYKSSPGDKTHRLCVPLRCSV